MPTPRRPKLTKDALHASTNPPNNCKVKAFRDQLDEESKAVLDEALGYKAVDYPARKLRDFLLSAGYPEDAVPGVEAITEHRAGRRPCRCKG